MATTTRCRILATVLPSGDAMRCPTDIRTFHYHAPILTVRAILTRGYAPCEHRHRTLPAARRCFEDMRQEAR